MRSLLDPRTVQTRILDSLGGKQRHSGECLASMYVKSFDNTAQVHWSILVYIEKIVKLVTRVHTSLRVEEGE